MTRHIEAKPLLPLLMLRFNAALAIEMKCMDV